MRIGIVVDLNHPDGKKFYDSLKELLTTLSDGKNDVFLLTLGNRTSKTQRGAQLDYVACSNSFFPFLFPLRVKGFFEILDGMRLDMIHLLDQSALSKLMLNYSIKRNLPLLLTVNPYEMEGRKKSHAFLYDAQHHYFFYFIHSVLENQGILSCLGNESYDEFRDFGFTESIGLFSSKQELMELYERARMQNI